MEPIDYSQPAELYVHSRRGRVRGAATFQKFSTAAEAVRYAVEVLSTTALAGAVIETELGRYEACELRSLYENSNYPLSRCDGAKLESS